MVVYYLTEEINFQLQNDHFTPRSTPCVNAPLNAMTDSGLYCDQMGKFFFNIWPFKTMKICRIGSLKIAKIGSNFCQAPKRTLKKFLTFHFKYSSPNDEKHQSVLSLLPTSGQK